jgi:hypothetical protein
VDRAGQGEREIVSNARLNAAVDEHWLIGDVAWLDENVVYFGGLTSGSIRLFGFCRLLRAARSLSARIVPISRW